MHIERIYWQQNFRTHPGDDPFLFGTLGMGIFINKDENVGDAIEEAKKQVNEYIQKCIIYPEHAHVEIRDVPLEEDKEFEQLKIALALIEYKEEAQAYLDTTDFKHAFEAKNLIKNKPSKS